MKLDKALLIFEELKTNWQLGRTHFEFGQLFSVQEKGAQAKKHFEQAIDLFKGMDALPDLERTQAALKSIHA